jgi:hypothetical protein
MPSFVKTVTSNKLLYSPTGDILHPFIFHAKPIFFDTELYFIILNHFNHAKHPRFYC